MNCPSCGAAVAGKANYCVSCGGRLPAMCQNCGAANQSDSRFCHACGFRLATMSPQPATPLLLSCRRCHSANEPGATFCYSCGFPLDDPGLHQRGASMASGAPAGFWIRFLAWLMDSVVLVIAHLAVLVLLPGISIEEYYSENYLWTTADTIMALAGAAYYTIGVSAFSTTLGKRALGLYVLRRDGTRVGPLRAFGRHLASGVSALLLFVGYLMIGWSNDKRGLHDHICDTVVVKR